MNTEPTLDLGKWLKQQRERAGMTQEQLADLAHVSNAVISLAEQSREDNPKVEKRPVSVKLVAQITHALGISPLDAAELMWSAALGYRVEIPRHASDAEWFYRLQPLLAHEKQTTIDAIVKMAVVIVDSVKAQDAINNDPDAPRKKNNQPVG